MLFSVSSPGCTLLLLLLYDSVSLLIKSERCCLICFAHITKTGLSMPRTGVCLGPTRWQSTVALLNDECCTRCPKTRNSNIQYSEYRNTHYPKLLPHFMLVRHALPFLFLSFFFDCATSISNPPHNLCVCHQQQQQAAGRCSLSLSLSLWVSLDSHQIKDEANQCIVVASRPAALYNLAHCLAKLIASFYLYGQVKMVMKLLCLSS